MERAPAVGFLQEITYPVSELEANSLCNRKAQDFITYLNSNFSWTKTDSTPWEVVSTEKNSVRASKHLQRQKLMFTSQCQMLNMKQNCCSRRYVLIHYRPAL